MGCTSYRPHKNIPSHSWYYKIVIFKNKMYRIRSGIFVSQKYALPSFFVSQPGGGHPPAAGFCNSILSIMKYLLSSIFTTLKTVICIYIFLPVVFFWGDRWL